MALPMSSHFSLISDGLGTQCERILFRKIYDPGLAGLTYDGGPAIFYWYMYHLPSAEKMSVSDCYMHSVYQ